jgi:hypothetical protein
MLPRAVRVIHQVSGEFPDSGQRMQQILPALDWPSANMVPEDGGAGGGQHEDVPGDLGAGVLVGDGSYVDELVAVDAEGQIPGLVPELPVLTKLPP